MRIAYVYDAVYPFAKGGGERRIYEVAWRLCDRGHEVSILGMKFWDGPETFEDHGLQYRALSWYMNPHNRRGRRSIAQALGFGASAWRLLANGRYDVIDCGQFPFLHLLAAKATSMMRGTPFVVTWYEVLKRQWLQLFGKLGLAAMLAEKGFCRLADRIVAISERTQAALLEIGARRERMSLILDGVNYHHIQSVTPGSVRTDLAYCGRLKSYKNVHLLIEALALLKRIQPAISAVIIGDGPESQALRDLAGRLGVAKNITFTGALDNFDEVVGWLKASKIFVHPSTKEGGSSMTLFEANASGLPVIAIRCPHGIDPSLIREGENGYFVESSPERIAEVALVLLNNPDRLSANSGNAKKMAANHDWDVVASQYEQLYEHEISMRRNAVT